MHRRQFMQSSLAFAAGASLPLELLAVGKRARIDADVAAISLDGAEVTLTKAEVKALVAEMRGALLLPGNAGYDSARAVWNGMFDRKPALIARCSGPADVINAVTFAREHDLLLAVRAGGHSMAGKSVCDGGLMIDLTQMNGVRVDPQRRRAIVEGGALLGALDHEAQRFGLAVTAGTVSHTGTAGLTLGGGHGRLARRFGMTSDNLISADVVTADGKFLRASADENPDLYWGLRGGGGNFGIVTAMEFQLYPFGPDVLSCTVMYPVAQAPDVFDFVNDFGLKADRELVMSGVLVMPPNGKAFAIISATYTGDDLSKGEKYVQPLVNFGKPMTTSLEPRNYLKVQSANDGNLAAGRKYYMKSGFMNELSPEFTKDLVERFEPDNDRQNIVLLNQQAGAIADFAPDATAYNHREAQFDMMIGCVWDNPDHNEKNVAWGRSYFQAMSPYTIGYYVNNAMDESASSVAKNYQGNRDRLVQLKNKYDPTNQFRLNANILPSV